MNNVNDFLAEYRKELKRAENEGTSSPDILARINSEAQNKLSAADYSFFTQNKTFHKEDYERGEQLFQATRSIFRTAITAATSILGLGAFTAMIGWVYAKSYFSTFSAEWILSSASFVYYLTCSAYTLHTILLLMWFALSYMFEKRDGESKIEAVWLVSGSLFLLGLIALGTASIAASYFWKIKFTPLFQIIWFLLGPFTFFVSFGMLVSNTKRGDAGWNRNTASCIASVCLGIYLIAQYNGEMDGKRDLNKEISRLPIVRVINDSHEISSFRLLHSVEDRVYLVKLDKSESAPLIIIKNVNEVVDIQGVKH